MLYKTENTTNKLNMTNPLQAYPVVSWKEIQGNKYIKAIDSAMLLQGGLPYVMKARAIGTGRYNSELLTVVFDKEYVENWIVTKLIRPLSNYGLDYVNNLVHDAWLKSNYPVESLIGDSCVRLPQNNEQQI